MSESTQDSSTQDAVAAPAKYVVVAGFAGEPVDGVAVTHDRGAVVTVGVEIDEATAHVESQRGRIVAYDEAVAAAVRATVPE